MEDQVDRVTKGSQASQEHQVSMDYQAFQLVKPKNC
jgi:hypothetical protein